MFINGCFLKFLGNKMYYVATHEKTDAAKDSTLVTAMKITGMYITTCCITLSTHYQNNH